MYHHELYLNKNAKAFLKCLRKNLNKVVHILKLQMNIVLVINCSKHILKPFIWQREKTTIALSLVTRVAVASSKIVIEVFVSSSFLISHIMNNI